MIKVAPLVGYKSYLALSAFHTLMLGLKMIPEYLGESYEEFFARVDAMSPEDQDAIIRKAVLFVPLQPDELEAILSFTTDANGVSYGPHNMGNLAPDVLHEHIVAVVSEVAKIKVHFLTEKEKKKLIQAQSISEAIS